MAVVVTPTAGSYHVADRVTVQSLGSLSGLQPVDLYVNDTATLGATNHVLVASGTTNGSGDVTFNNVAIPSLPLGVQYFFTAFDGGVEDNSANWTLLAALPVSGPKEVELGLKGLSL
jgi:hypothetical protein